MPSRPFSARIAADVAERLESRGARTGLNKSRLAERYIDEGMRMDDHPGITFRDGPAGRRAGLVAGPDLWEVVGAVRSSGLKGDAGVRSAAEWAALTAEQVRTALRYYGDYPDEINEWIRRNTEEADAAEAAWRRQRDPSA